MTHLSDLIQDLGMILMTAGIVMVICKMLHQPLVLGYLLAGLIVGPHVAWLPTVKDVHSVQVWAEIGVIILMFGLGLEFNVKKLVNVGRPASQTALFELIAMTGLGVLTGALFGWSRADSVFLGGILAISSTAIIVSSFRELGLKNQRWVPFVYGVLVIEDIVAVLILIVLSTLALTSTLMGLDLALATGQLFLFLILCFAIGIYLLPSVIRYLGRHLDGETLLLVSLGLCLTMVIVTTQIGFSPALGAFVMGSLLSQTHEGHRIEQLIQPIRNLFAAIFFVSVGMLLDPKALMLFGPQILIITLVTIVGKTMSTIVGALFSKIPLRQAVMAGMSLGQIGEFSFIIATFGLNSNLTSAFLPPIAISVSALTTFATPYLIRLAPRVATWLEKHVPSQSFAKLQSPQLDSTNSSATAFLQTYWHAYGWRSIINSAIVIGIFVLGSRVHVWLTQSPTSLSIDTIHWVLSLLCFLFALPFLWALISTPASRNITEQDQKRLQKSQKIFAVGRSLMAALLFGLLVHLFVPFGFLSLAIFLICALLGWQLSRLTSHVYMAIETQFLENLDSNSQPHLAPWDATVRTFTVHPNSAVVGKTLEEFGFREKFGVIVPLVVRGQHIQYAPNGTWQLMPYDQVSMIGSDEQLDQIENWIEKHPAVETSHLAQSDLSLLPVQLSPQSPLIGRQLRQSGLREFTSGLVVGIEREGARMLNPLSTEVLKSSDILWILGDPKKISKLKKREG